MSLDILLMTLLGGFVYYPFLVVFGIKRKLPLLKMVYSLFRFIILMSFYSLFVAIIRGDASLLKYFVIGLAAPGFVMMFEIFISPFVGRSGFSLILSFVFWKDFDRLNNGNA